jgi:hypothetical protein
MEGEWLLVNGMQEVKGSCLLRSTTPPPVRRARCVPVAPPGSNRLAAKLQVSAPMRGGAVGPSQGGSAGSNPVGATIDHQSNTV